MRRILSIVVLLFCVFSSHAQTEKPSQEALDRGVIHSRVACSDPEQTYALYLPPGYTAEKRWPIVYAFDPGARGQIPVELMREAAERYGFILAGSNNSRNGPWKSEFEAAYAMVGDTQRRFSIDTERIYFAGFSGGARVAAQLAQLCKCAAGVFLNGAGFPGQAAPSRETSFAVYSAVGTEDFNYPEVVGLQEKLEAASYPHWFRTFEGPHQWAPEEVAGEALAWFQIVAMAKGAIARDEKFLQEQAVLERGRASPMERGGDALGAWREYKQAAATFAAFHLGETFSQEADRLAQEKSVREGAKREKAEFEEQERLSGPISSGIAALAGGPEDSPELFGTTREKIRLLREKTEHEKRPEKRRVYERALAGVLVEAMEAGNERKEAKEYRAAAIEYELAAEAKPDSMWALPSLAIANALNGDRKGALAALRKAREASKDKTAFAAWLRDEPAFEKLRATREFAALLGAPAEQRQNP